MLRDDLNEAIANLLATRQRSLLALIGIVIGAGSVIAMINVGRIVETESLKQFQALGTDLVAIELGLQGPSSFTLERYDDFVDRVDLFTAVAPMVLQSLPNSTHKGAAVQGSIIATTEEVVDVLRLEVENGRFFSSDIDGHEPFLVAGAHALQTLAGRWEPNRPDVGDLIQSRSGNFEIVGVLHPSADSSIVPYRANDMYLVSVEVLKRLTPRGIVGLIVGRLRPGLDHHAAADQIEDYFARLVPSVSARVKLAEREMEIMRQQSRTLALFLGTVGCISLIVGGVGVMNIMLVSVTERRPEIGLRLAVGARPRDITRMFFIEAMVLSVAGGLIGTALGLGSSYLIATYSGWSFFVFDLAIIVGLVVSVAVGVFFGYYPARLAARLDPVVSLRAE